MHTPEDIDGDEYVQTIVAVGLWAEGFANLRTLVTEVRKTNAILKAIGRVTE